MCAYDDGVSDVWSVTEPIARKKHACDECLAAIAPGSRYRRVASLFDGSWSVFTTHLDCSALAKKLGDLMCSGNYSIGQMREHLRESGVIGDDEGYAPVPLPTLRDVGEVRAAWREIQGKHGATP
jgi:hypothetical protein